MNAEADDVIGLEKLSCGGVASVGGKAEGLDAGPLPESLSCLSNQFQKHTWEAT